jgi:sorting nexin-9/18/33
MATLPRRISKSPLTPPTVSHTFFSQLTRPQSEFDAGINTSAAWTEHLERGPSLSDEEPEDDGVDLDDSKGQPARALYQFEGKAEFREMSVEAGDEIAVVKEELSDGWSLVRNNVGEVGLLPRTYYTVNKGAVCASKLCNDKNCSLQPTLSRPQILNLPVSLKKGSRPPRP